MQVSGDNMHMSDENMSSDSMSSASTTNINCRIAQYEKMVWI